MNNVCVCTCTHTWEKPWMPDVLVSLHLPSPRTYFLLCFASSMLQEADSVRLYHICDLASTGFRQWKFRKHQWKIRKLSREKLGHFFLALVPFLWQLLWLSVAEAPTQTLLSKAPVLTRLWYTISTSCPLALEEMLASHWVYSPGAPKSFACSRPSLRLFTTFKLSEWILAPYFPFLSSPNCQPSFGGLILLPGTYFALFTDLLSPLDGKYLEGRENILFISPTSGSKIAPSL